MWWWPDPMGTAYWPLTVPRDETLEAFVAAFASLGYQVTSTAAHETGQDRIAIYAKNGRPTHAARQLDDGRWTSKLGRSEDVTHERLEELGVVLGDVYGAVAVIMARPRS
jgi:hypothetical protein